MKFCALMLTAIGAFAQEEGDSILSQVGVDEDSTVDILLKVRNPVLDADADADSSEWNGLLPNINMVGMSYDVLRGNPHPTGGGLDPGWRFEIFETSYDDEKTVFFGAEEYRVPDGVQVASCPVCSLDFSSTNVMTAGDYANSLRVAVNIGGKFKGAFFKAAFKASADFQKVSKRAAESKSLFMESSALCSFYCPRIAFNSPPRVTEHFKKAVDALPWADVSAYDNDQSVRDAYDTFVDLHGTHFAIGLTMGATFGQRYELTETSVRSMENLGVSVKASASFKSRRTSVGVSALTEIEREQAQEFSSRTESESTFSYGGKPAANPDDLSDTTLWRENARADPLPIRYDLRDIFELINEKILPGAANLPEKRALLQAAVENYCSRLQDEFNIVCTGEEPVATESPNDELWCDDLGGILHETDDNVCCAASCGYCGGPNCSGLCCASRIIPQNNECGIDGQQPPCLREAKTEVSTEAYGTTTLAENFNDFDEWSALGRPALTGLRFRVHNAYISSIQAVYKPYSANQHGTEAGVSQQQFLLENGEHIVSVDICAIAGATPIRSLRFRTNRRESEVFGAYHSACKFNTVNFPSRLLYISGASGVRLNNLAFHHAASPVE